LWSCHAPERMSGSRWAKAGAWGRHPNTDEVIAEIEANSSLTPALNYYRANVNPESFVGPALVLPPVQAATMGVWSTGDFALTEGQMTRSAKHVAGPWRYERVEGQGHWMQLEAADEVSRLLIDFLS
jgi:pimeloyl-ACP methyl ester carboxylesterase